MIRHLMFRTPRKRVTTTYMETLGRLKWAITVCRDCIWISHNGERNGKEHGKNKWKRVCYEDM